LVAAVKFWVAATKNLFVVPNFVAVTKPLFFRVIIYVILGVGILALKVIFSFGKSEGIEMCPYSLKSYVESKLAQVR